MDSISTMVKKISGLYGTNDVTPWEEEFIGSILSLTNNGKDTTRLTDRQVTVVERLCRKHFS